MIAGDLLTNNVGTIFLVLGRSKSKKTWTRKVYVYSSKFGILELNWKEAKEFLQELK